MAGLDQATKAIARASLELGDRAEPLPVIAFERTRNSGVAFGIGDGGGALVIVLTAVALVAVVALVATRIERHGAWLALGLLGGGATGNLIDRVREGAVTDFIDLPSWPTFNLADVAIVAGVAVLFWTAFREPEDEPA